MGKKNLLSVIFTILLTGKVFCTEDNAFVEKNELGNGDQSFFNEENEDTENSNCEEDTVDLFQSSLDSIQQLLRDNVDDLNHVKKIISSIFQGQNDFNEKEYLDQYICSKKISFEDLKSFQNHKQHFELVDCFIDLGKIDSLKEKKIVKASHSACLIKSLVYEHWSANKIKIPNFIARSIFDGESIKKIFSNPKDRQRINKLIKETFAIKKNSDYCQHLHFAVLDYENTFSVESIKRLFTQYKFFEEKDSFEKYEAPVSQFFSGLRRLDEDNEEYQSSLDIVYQNIIKNPSLLKVFLCSLVDKPICGVKNTEIEQGIRLFPS
jgi:hypothetical protein